MWKLTGSRQSGNDSAQAQASATTIFSSIRNIFNKTLVESRSIERQERGTPATMPERVTFVDVETTGLSDSDRIVTIGVICLDTTGLSAGSLKASTTHLIFDPGKKSHPKAELVHGFDDWTLRHQDSFSQYADTIRTLISEGSLIVGHNVAFDMRFINRELDIAGKATLSLSPTFCTMEAVRNLGFQGSASLSSICGRVGIKRQGNIHGALEDAWLSMQLYLLLHYCPAFETTFSNVCNPELLNFRAPPPHPDGPLPRRRARSGQKSEAKTLV